MTYSEFLKGGKLKRSLATVASASAVPGMVEQCTPARHGTDSF